MVSGKNNLVLLTFVFFMSGCSLSMNDCDPRKDPGFFTKLGCATTGKYSDRVTYKEEQLKALRLTNKNLHDQKNQLLNDTELLENDITIRKKKLIELQSQITKMKKDLNYKEALSKEMEEKLDKLNASIEELKNLPKDSITLEKQEKLDKIQEDYDEALSVLTVE
ncbi:MAG: hypothetical protein ACI4V7_08720 [Succinivibrionaceae bacterium]